MQTNTVLYHWKHKTVFFNYFKEQQDRNQLRYKINLLFVGNKECEERNFPVPAWPCFSNLQYCMFWQNISLVCIKYIIHSEGYRADIRNKHVGMWVIFVNGQNILTVCKLLKCAVH